MGDGKNANCPKHKVWLSEYWIGAYCVTNRQYGRFVKETGHRAKDDDVWKRESKFVRCPKKQEHPVVDVDWNDAESYAAWAGLSLPTEAQWEKAVRGPLGLLYPWGDEWDATRCRHDKNRGSEETSAVRAYANGVSGYGTYGQSGNVMDWCADYHGGDYENGPTADPKGPKGPKDREYCRVHRGGSWAHRDPSDFRGARRAGNPTLYTDDAWGFRLVRPAS
jgi:formylglycine-generating enzyme required for sulfatase activity